MDKILRTVSVTAGFAYAVFIGMFACDASSGSGRVIHLLPAAAVAAASLAGLRSVRSGGILCAALAAGFTVFFHTYRALSSFVAISLPLFLISALFLYAAAMKKGNG